MTQRKSRKMPAVPVSRAGVDGVSGLNHDMTTSAAAIASSSVSIELTSMPIHVPYDSKTDDMITQSLHSVAQTYGIVAKDGKITTTELCHMFQYCGLSAIATQEDAKDLLNELDTHTRGFLTQDDFHDALSSGRMRNALARCSTILYKRHSPRRSPQSNIFHDGVELVDTVRENRTVEPSIKLTPTSRHITKKAYDHGNKPTTDAEIDMSRLRSAVFNNSEGDISAEIEMSRQRSAVFNNSDGDISAEIEMSRLRSKTLQEQAEAQRETTLGAPDRINDDLLQKNTQLVLELDISRSKKEELITLNKQLLSVLGTLQHLLGKLQRGPRHPTASSKSIDASSSPIPTSFAEASSTLDASGEILATESILRDLANQELGSKVCQADVFLESMYIVSRHKRLKLAAVVAYVTKVVSEWNVDYVQVGKLSYDFDIFL